uniref:hypothetical protein n=1 Tax=Burkholderia anthina TaxID=179879 RepID=UPI00158D800A|nr:hypothetical protein [Burkholderia anthina]
MADAAAVVVHAIDTMEMSSNGEFLLIHGGQPTVALHRSMFDALLVALPGAIERAQRIVGHSPDARFALHSTGWEIGRIDNTPNVIVRFNLQGGVGIGFSVPREQVPLIMEALRAAIGLASVAQPQGVTLQ